LFVCALYTQQQQQLRPYKKRKKKPWHYKPPGGFNWPFFVCVCVS